MEITQATADEYDGIAETARQSFRASYGLSPRDIDHLVEGAFSPEALEARTDDPDRTVLVAAVDDEAVPTSGLAGFVEVDDEDTLQWLHVHPDARGRGVGSALVEHAKRSRDDAILDARLLVSANEGNRFLQKFGLYPTDDDVTVVAEQEFEETVFTDEWDAMDADQPVVAMPDEVTVDGETGWVQSESPITGTDAPFYPVYGAQRSADRLGFFCSRCGTTDVTADGTGRLECVECANTHRADEWDGAYL